MGRTWKLRSATTLAILALGGAIAFASTASAQENDASSRKATWMSAGFVRPGSPSDAKGAILDDVLGGTIFYAVYQLPTGNINPNDPYNTGFANFAKSFVPGAGNGSTKSPATLGDVASMPKYLYLYQIVNDRGLDQPLAKDGIRLAANTDVKSRDIGSLVLKLPVAADAIQSWGYFKNSGFAINAFDRGSSGIRPSSVAPPLTHIGVSANPSVLDKLRGLSKTGYSRVAAPVAFNPTSGFAVETAGKNLKTSYFAEELGKRTERKERLVAWEQEAMKAAETGGETPDSVDLMKFSDNDPNKAGAVLRALFASNPIKTGDNSVILGFTSNLPPGNDLLRIQDIDAAKKNTGIRTVAMDDFDFGAGGLVPLPKEDLKDAPVAKVGSGLRPSNIVADGVVSPGDIPSGSQLVDKGEYKTLGGTVYFAVFKRVNTTAGDTWGVGRSDFDSLFQPGESYRATFSPRLDTDAEYLYLYEVVNDRGFHDLKLPQNKATTITPVANDTLAQKRAPITREVASFSLFLRVDPRLITSWGAWDGSAFNLKVPDLKEIQQVGNDPDAKPAVMKMAASSNLSLLDTLYPDGDKAYRPWSPPRSIDYSRTDLSVGSDTKNITGNRIRPVSNDRAGHLRFVANRTLETVAATGGSRPDYVQILYFDGQNPVNGATLDGITLGPAEVARAVFKAEWLTKPIVEGQHSVVFGFTSNVEPIRAPVRLKDLNSTVNHSSETQERVFLSPDRIRAVALNALRQRAPGVAPGTAPSVAPGVAEGVAIGTAPGISLASIGLDGSADEVAVAIAEGRGAGVIPAGLSALARGSVASGVGISPSVATPAGGTIAEAVVGGGAGTVGIPPVVSNTGSTGGGGFGGGFPIGGVGALGTARPATMGGGGFGGGGGNNGSTDSNGNNQGSGGGNGAGSGSGSGSGSGTGESGSNANNNIDINFNISQTNQQQQQQYQYQNQKQSQNQNQSGRGHGHGNGNVVPAPASLLLGLLGVPGFYLIYRRRRAAQASPTSDSTSQPTTV